MNRTKIKQIIAISLAVASFNFATGSSMPAFAEIFQKDVTIPTDNNYYNYLYNKLNNTTVYQTLSCTEEPISIDSPSTNEDLSSLFKVKYSKEGKNTLINSINGTIPMPANTALLDTFNLVISPSKEIENLYIKMGNGAIKKYNNLSQNTLYTFQDINLAPNTQFDVFIKYTDTTDLVTQKFTTTSYTNSTNIIDSSSKYVLKNDKLFNVIKWTEINNDGLLNSEPLYKKVFFNDYFYDVLSEVVGPTTYYYAEIELNENNIDKTDMAEIYSCDSLFQPTKSNVSRDRSNYTVNPVIPTDSGVDDNFQLKDQILHYGSNKQFTISTSFANVNNNVDIIANNIMLTCTSQDSPNSTTDLNYTVSADKKSLNITNVPFGNNIIRVIYTDVDSNLYTQKLSTTIDSSKCSVLTPNNGQDVYLNPNMVNSSFKLNLNDPYSNINNLSFVQLYSTEEPTTSSSSTLYYRIKNSKGIDINLDYNLITKTINANTMDLDFLPAMKASSLFVEDTYTIEYVYFNSVGISSIPNGSTDLLESFQFVIDNTPPKISSTLLESLTPKDNKYYFKDTDNTNIDVNFEDTNLDSSLTFTSNLDDMVDSKNTVFYELTQDNVVRNELVNESTNNLDLDLSNTSDFTEGTYKLEVKVSDSSGNITSKIYDFAIDKTDAEISSNTLDALTPIDGKYYFNQTANKNIDIKFNDNSLNFSSLNFDSNLDNMPGSKNKVFYKLTQNAVVKNDLVTRNGNELKLALSNTANFTEGTYKLDITVFDSAGNTSEKTYIFIIDKTAPVVNVTNSGSIDQILSNNNNFSLYKNSLTITAFKNYRDPVLFPVTPTGLLFQPAATYNDISNFNIKIKKLNSYDLSDATNIKTLTASESTYTIQTEGFYQIIYTYTDLANNTTSEEITYAAVDKETSTVNLLYFDESGNSVNPINGSNFIKPITPYIEVSDLSFTDENHTPMIDFSLTTSYYNNSIFKTDTYNSTNLIPVKSLPNGKSTYGKSYYYLGKSEGSTITKTVLKDVKAISSCTVTNNLGEKFKYENNLFAVEVTDPHIDINLNDTNTASSIVFINNSKNPEFDIAVTNGIAGVDKTEFSITKDGSNDLESDFSLSGPTTNGNASNYTLSYTGDLEDLDNYNGYYTLTFTYYSNTGKSYTETRNFVIDTSSPSYVISFNSTSQPLIDGKNQVIDDKLTIDTANSDKISALETKKVYTSYKDLFVTIELLDNSFNTDDGDFKGLTEKLLSKLNITLDNKAIETDSTSKKILLGKEYFAQDKIYKLNISSSDKSLNTTSRDIDIIVDRTAPTVTFGVTDENNNPVTRSKVNDTYYFNKTIKPYINISDSICNKDEIKYSMTINDILYNKEYTVTYTNEKDFKAALEGLSDGEYNIKVKVTDFAGNTVSNILGDFNYSTTNGVNLVVDTTTPSTELTMLKDNFFTPLDSYMDVESKIYVVVNNEPYFDAQNFKNSLRVTGSNVISGNNNLAPMNNIVVTDVTDTMIDKVSNSNQTTKIFEISNNNSNFTNGYYKIIYDLTDFSGNSTINNEVDFLVDNTAITVTNNFDYNNKYFNSTYDFSVDIPAHYSGYKDSSIKLLKDGEDVTAKYVTDDFNKSMNGGAINVSVPLSDADKSNEGQYSFEVTLTDYTGKEYTYSEPFEFIMDRTPIELTYFDFDLGNGQLKDEIYYTNSEDINMNFVLAPDIAAEASRTVTINGIQVPSYNNQISNDYFVNDGEYTIIVSLQDKAGNTSSYTRTIIVDRTAASVSLNGFDGVIDSSDNNLYINKVITPSITVDDRFGEDISRRTPMLNNSIYTHSEISENGTHTYSINVWDLAGNESTKSISFILDTVKPDIIVNDIIDGKYYNTDVKPTYSTPDTTAVLTAYLNGSPYDGSTITGDGNYTLKLLSTDKAQNVTEVTYSFVIDTVSPNISISGINENEINGVITPVLKVDDPLSTVLVILNGEDYYGGAITESGKYTLLVKAMDKAGNISEKIISFIVDADVPQIFVSNIENGKLYIDEIEPQVTVTKDATVTMLLNGEAYDGSNITTPGEYELIINAVDSLNNKNTAVYRFTLAAKGSPEAQGLESNSEGSGTSILDTIKDILPTTGILLGLSAIGSLAFINIKKKIK
jgi:hypothetical protein